MRIFLILFSFILSAHSWGQAVTVTQVLAGDSLLTPSTGTVMVTDPATDDEESTAMVAYYPIASTSVSAVQWESTIFSTNVGHPVPVVIFNGGSNAYDLVPFIAFKVKSTFTTSMRIFVAYKPSGGGTNYNIAKLIQGDGGSTYNTVGANSEITVRVALSDVCGVSTSSCYNTEFNNFVNGSTATIVSSSQLFYVHYVDPISNPNPTPGTAVDPAALSGVYVKARFSSQLPTPQPTLSSLNLARGDTQLTINYSTGFSNLQADAGPWRTLALKVISTITDGNNLFNSVGGGLVGACTSDGVPGDLLPTAVCYQLYPYAQNGSLTVSNLTNNVTYLLSVAHVSKFKFVTTIPTNGSGRPQEIQAFIKEQNCFFLSAGFGDHHYVLDYMRTFRDTVLLKNTVGKLFVNYYYDFAPQYTPYIYQNPPIAALMRGLGYGLYYFLNAWMVILSAITAFFAFIRFKKLL